MASHTLVVEFGNDRNEMIMFDPLQAWMRGRWSPAGVGAAHSSVSDPHAYPALPGLYCEIDAEHKRAKIHDPLADDQDLLDELNKTHKRLMKNEQFRPVTTQYVNDMTDDQVASWVYHLRALVRKGDARVMQGDINAQPKGRVRRSYFNPTQLGEPVYEDEYQARDKYGADWKKVLRDRDLAGAKT